MGTLSEIERSGHSERNRDVTPSNQPERLKLPRASGISGRVFHSFCHRAEAIFTKL